MQNNKTNLIDLFKQLKGIEMAKSHYRDILLSLKELYKEKEKYENLLGISLDKVERLNSLNLISIFNKLTGRHTKILEFQKQEYLRITLEFNEIVRSIKILNFEKSIIEDKIDKEVPLQKRLEGELNKLESEVEDTDLKEFKLLYKEIEDKSKLLKEIEEAIKACEESIFLLRKAENYLRVGVNKDELKGFSIEKILEEEDFDIVELQDMISKIKFKLHEFENEMSDLHNHLKLITIEKRKYSENFGKMFREVVLIDWQNNNSLYNSIEFLENYTSSMTENKKILTKDKKIIVKKLNVLELKKDELLSCTKNSN